MRISILIVLAGFLVGQGGASANLVVWDNSHQGASGEGNVTFFAVYAEGNFAVPVAEKRLGAEWCSFMPSGEITCDTAPSLTGDTQSFSLSAGNYELRSYIRPCNGNCNSFDQIGFECREPFSLKSGETLYFRREASGTKCNLARAPTRLQVPGAADLSGRILRSDGAPAGALRIVAIEDGSNGMFRTTWTDSAGRYLLQNVPRGEYYLAVLEAGNKTFFPGVAAQAAATLIGIKDGASPGRFDFSLAAR